MLTPSAIQAISDPIEEVYIHITDELLVNIGKHLRAPTWTHTAAWEIQKLSELGQLTEENAKIINKWIKEIPQDVRDAMEKTRRQALDKIEKDVAEAVRQGKLPSPMSDSTLSVMRVYSEQAVDQLNLVNTVMLQSSVQQYQRGVQLTKEEYEKLLQQAETSQLILNEAAGSVATGVETREKALRRAISRISDEGLTGFIDRGGHHWSPEAYVNMDIRTTVHNTAIQSVKSFMQDYNSQVFQVSSHAAARPLCYPYQGKFYSWDNTAGEIELGNGDSVHYEPLDSTSYGEAAGLFGINCGHYPIPIIAGVTIPHGADNIQPKEENDKAYEESQEQRALERKIRAAKREVEMAGDLASPEMKQRVKDAQAEMRDFINRTGRTRRYDREKIGGLPKTQNEAQVKLPSYSTNGLTEPKRPWKRDFDNEEEYRAARAVYDKEREEYRQKMAQAIETAENYKRFGSPEELRRWASDNGIVLEEGLLDKIDLRSFNEASIAIDEMLKRFPEVKSYQYEASDGSTRLTEFRLGTTSDGILSAGSGISFNPKWFGDYHLGVTEALTSETTGWLVRGDGTFSTLVRHEFGHNVQSYIERKIADKYHWYSDDWRTNYSTFDEYKVARDKYIAERNKFDTELVSMAGLRGSSEYSNTNSNELFAEGFAEYTSGGKTEFGKQFGEFLKRWY